MKTILILTSVIACAALGLGCSFAARNPEMYRDDTAKVLETKNGEIRACYDNVLKATPGVGGKVTVKFEVAEETGKIKNVIVDKPTTTAPDAVSDCVKKNIEGLAISPGDARLGQASFVYEFSQPKS
jgi:hypothetical protein